MLQYPALSLILSLVWGFIAKGDLSSIKLDELKYINLKFLEIQELSCINHYIKQIWEIILQREKSILQLWVSQIMLLAGKLYMTRLQSWFSKYNAWSFTKHRLWRECKLAYYFSYIATALVQSQTLNINQLKKLKKLDSRFVIQGKLVHDAIEQQINNYQRGKRVEEKEAEDYFIMGIEKYRANPSQMLVEYLNGDQIKQSFFDRIREDGLDQLSLFFGSIWPEIENRQYLRHEKFDRFQVGNTPVIVKVDYASKGNDDSIIISDWKTGIDSEEFENDLQVGAYVLWASDYYNQPPNQISSELVYLTTGRRTKFSFSHQQLKSFKELITTDFGAMNRSYEIEHFEANPSPKKCIRCPFASECSYSQSKQFLG